MKKSNKSPTTPRSAWGKWTVIGIPYFWLFVMLLVPFIYLAMISVAEMVSGGGFMPVYRDGGWFFKDNYSPILTDIIEGGPYRTAYLSSVYYAGLTAIGCLIIGYPFAYFMARAPKELQPTLLMFVMLPFWISMLIRVYAIKILFDDSGFLVTTLTGALTSMGLIDEPLHLLGTSFSMMFGMIYVYLPFMILPLYSTLSKMDSRYWEAAADLGSTPLKTFFLITVPLSKAGIIAGLMLVFIPCIGEYVIPQLLGGADTLMIGRVLADEYFQNADWPRASALAISIILMVIVPMMILNKYQEVAGETK
ncbi:putrescine ABC transporter permease [Formosimonas limnophila]|uniref:Putrescine ABC transporter permease n=1 Tax=Formosimonas limnophila TaxID=1384487 RepID=A0A8J3CMP4_9BURK|nr:ABC transporter permease [Formosimonas limnophila]GHA71700.1 putrescine ABC transporter permease [Formosimonas limnophila]